MPTSVKKYQHSLNWAKILTLFHIPDTHHSINNILCDDSIISKHLPWFRLIQSGVLCEKQCYMFILHCISQLGENFGGQSYWVSQNNEHIQDKTNLWRMQFRKHNLPDNDRA